MNALIEIFTNPKAVFDAQREDSAWLVPALVIIAFSILTAIAMSMMVDQEALVRAQIEAQIEQMEQSGMPQAQIDQVRMQMEQSTQIAANPIVTVGGAILSVIIIFFIVVLLHAVYYLIVGKIIKAEYDFGEWLAFSVWGRMPMVIGSIVVLAAVLFMAEQTDPNAYNLLAFSTWMAVPNENNMFVGNFVKTFDLIVIWSIAIMTIGFNNWTEKSIPVSLAIVAAPYVVIYGAMMAI